MLAPCLSVVIYIWVDTLDQCKLPAAVSTHAQDLNSLMCLHFVLDSSEACTYLLFGSFIFTRQMHKCWAVCCNHRISQQLIVKPSIIQDSLQGQRFGHHHISKLARTEIWPSPYQQTDCQIHSRMAAHLQTLSAFVPSWPSLALLRSCLWSKCLTIPYNGGHVVWFSTYTLFPQLSHFDGIYKHVHWQVTIELATHETCHAMPM